MAYFEPKFFRKGEAIIPPVILVLALLHIQVQDARLLCETPQFLEYGQPGEISCSISGEPNGIYWYNTTDTLQVGPFAKYVVGSRPSQQDGFHIHPNGSLIFSNVSFEHEHDFKMVALYHETGHEEAVVSVIVTVTPQQSFPYINLCAKKRVCFADNRKFREMSNLTCSIFASRPATNLTWLVMGFNNTQLIPSTTTVFEEHGLISSHARVSLPVSLQKPLALLVCRVETKFPMHKEPSHLLVETADLQRYDINSKKLNFKIGTSQTLSCDKIDSMFFVWKRNSSGVFDVIATQSPGTPTFVSKPYRVSEKGSLVIPQIALHHAGMYTCVFGNGEKGGHKSFEAVVLVPPDPGYLIIKQCEHFGTNDCFVETTNEGKVTCTVKRIYPEVQLEWQEVGKLRSPSVSLGVSQTKVLYNGETFEISSEISYSLLLPLVNATLECRVGGQYETDFALTRNVTLIPTTASEKTSLPGKRTTLVTLVTVFALFALLAVVALLFLFAYLNNTATIQKTFREELKARYVIFCENIKIAPSDDRKFCVEDMFVENGLELMNKGIILPNESTSLQSHHQVFEQKLTKRIFLIGEAGTGKTTLSLRAAYDWYTKNENSPLKSVELLIVLQLSLIENNQTIYQAIRHQLLVKDSRISERNIKRIMKKCSSCVIILDGYDEYVNRGEKSPSDVNSILSGDLFPNFRTIISSRPIWEPKQNKHLTIIRITGFNEVAHGKYFERLFSERTSAHDDLRNVIKTNPILQRLSYIPFFFGLLTHITNNSSTLENITSVTTYFNLLVTSLISHEKDKGNLSLRVDQSKLDEITFKHLVTSGKQVVWSKDELADEIGEEVCETFLRFGILIEEDIIDIPSPISERTEGLERKRKVRFYHQIFAEWCAARHVARHADNELITSSITRDCGLLYLKRFACGLNLSVVKTILKTVGSSEEKMALLLEQMDHPDSIKEFEDDIRILCREKIILSGDETLASQQLILHFLQKVSDKKIPIPEVEIHKCYDSYEQETSALTLSTGSKLLPLPSLKSFRVTLEKLNFQENDQMSFILFSLKCASLKNLVVTIDRQPFRVTDKRILREIKERQIKVEWCTMRGDNFYLENEGSWPFGESRPFDKKGRKPSDSTVGEHESLLQGLTLHNELA